MKCPYNLNKKTVIQTIINSLDNTEESSGKVDQQVIQIEEMQFPTCFQEECAAWDREHNRCTFSINPTILGGEDDG